VERRSGAKEHVQNKKKANDYKSLAVSSLVRLPSVIPRVGIPAIVKNGVAKPYVYITTNDFSKWLTSLTARQLAPSI
jgi:hypothetical protein